MFTGISSKKLGHEGRERYVNSLAKNKKPYLQLINLKAHSNDIYRLKFKVSKTFICQNKLEIKCE